MEFAVEFLMNLIYVRCFIWVGDLFFSLKRKNNKYENLVWIVSTFVASIASIYAVLGVKAICHVLCVVITLAFFFREKKRVLGGIYLGVASLLSTIDMIIRIVISEVLIYFQFPEIEYVNEAISIIIMALLILILGKYYQTKYPNGMKSIGIKQLLLLAIILLIDGLILFLFGNIINTAEVSRKWLLIIAYLGVVIGILIQIVLLINALITRNVHKENEALAKQYLEGQKEHYLYLEKREYETKRFRHDIKNHLMVLESCIINGEYVEAEKYLNALNESVNTFGSHISVNNGIADAILNKFYLDAQEKGIELKVKGHFPLECNISAFDMCTVLSNLLSNAILAESQCDGTEVVVDIRYTSEEVSIWVENDYNHELQRKDGELKTTKQDGVNHGFGLRNVRECVANVGGDILITTKDNRFKVMVHMGNEQKESI